MSLLLKDARFGTRAVSRSRLSSGLWLSVVTHAAIVGVLTAIVPTRASENTPTPGTRSIGVFRLAAIEPTALPPAPVSVPRAPSPPRPAPPVRTAMITEVQKPAAVAPIAAKAVEPPPATVLPTAVPGFERSAEPALPVRPPETGLFERANGARSSQAAASVTTGGFGSLAPSQRAAAQEGNDVTGGRIRSPRERARPVVGRAGAEADRLDPSRSCSSHRRSTRTKPETHASRAPWRSNLEFTAAGEVRVLRVVSGLGHGLDEAAERAASRIRFKPAQSDGRTVVSRAMVYITFRLS